MATSATDTRAGTPAHQVPPGPSLDDRAVRPVTMPLVDRLASAVVTGVPPVILVIGMILGWVERPAGLAGPPDPGRLLRVIGSGHHGRVPPPAHPPQLQDQPLGPGGVRGARVRGRRGPGDRLGRHPPQAPPVLRRRGRPAQPPRRPRLGWRGALPGLFHAHIGWVFSDMEVADERRYAKDLLADPLIKFVDRTFVLWVVARARRRVRPRCRADRHGHRRPDRRCCGAAPRGSSSCTTRPSASTRCATSSAAATTTPATSRATSPGWRSRPGARRGTTTTTRSRPPTGTGCALADRPLGGDDPGAGDDRARLGRRADRPGAAARAQGRCRRRQPELTPWRSPGPHRCGASSRPRFPRRPFAVRFWDGTAVPATEPAAPTFTFRSPRALAHVLRAPGELGLGRAYVARADRGRRHRRRAA